MELILCEKSSVAKEVAAAVGAKKNGNSREYVSDRYIVTCAQGHLLRLDPAKMGFTGKPTLSLIENNENVFVPNKATKKILDGIVKLIADKRVTGLINFCDPDTAGEIIFSNIYKYSKTDKPVLGRCWTSDLLSSTLINQLILNIEPAEKYYAHGEAEAIRFFSDLMIGYNLSTALSIKKGKFGISLGRVQTSVLTEIVKRYLDNKKFVPKTTYAVKIDTNFGEGRSNETFDTRPLSIKLIGELKSELIEDSSESAAAKELYNKSTLLVDAAKAGIKAATATKALQEMYESIKVTSYPRTGSKYLDENMSTKTKLFNQLTQLGYEEPINTMLSRGKSVFNDKNTKGHYALIILNATKANKIIKESPSSINARILKLIRTRMLVRSSPKVEYTQRKARLVGLFNVDGVEKQLTFNLEARKITNEGWIKYDTSKRSTYENNAKLLSLTSTSDVSVESAYSDSITTKAPPLYTEGTVIKWMESIGLGTPATIESYTKLLIGREYLKDNLEPTDLGINIYEDVKDLMIGNPEVTKKLDSIMDEVIDNGDVNGFKSSLEKVQLMIKDLHSNLVNADMDKYVRKPAGLAVSATGGKCTCGSNEIKDEYMKISCKTCKRSVGRTVMGKVVGKAIQYQLLAGAKVKLSLVSAKTKKPYTANVTIGDDGKCKLEF